MQLKRNRTRVQISGVGPVTTTANGYVYVTLTNRNQSGQQLTIQALVVPRITGQLPTETFDSPFIDELPSHELADPHHHRPGGIDILLGAGAWAAIINDAMQLKQFNGHQVAAQSTIFGWVIFGQMLRAAHRRLQKCHAMEFEDARVDELLVKYWNADAIPAQRQWTPEERRAEDIFAATHRRDVSGRYSVDIPIKEHTMPLGNSYRTAKACFLGVERRWQRNPQLFAFYKAVFDDYRGKRQMVLAPERPTDDAESYTMPHHPINVNGQTAKPRVVFNASAPTQSGVSFNDQQIAGPKLQDDLVTIFLRFRARRLALIGDIIQMFRQVNINPAFWNYQRVLWRDSPAEPLLEYIITTICWGQTSASFNAVRAVRQCATDEQHRYPVGALAALNDLYVDDLLTGADSEPALTTVYNEVTQLLKRGGFELSKWATNCATLSASIANESETVVDCPLDCGVLGMRWHTISDTLQVKIRQPIAISDHALTKRRVISATAQIYDPSGLFLPVIMTGKILQQDIWRSGIGWDVLLPPPLIAQWHSYQQSIAALGELSVPRWLNTLPDTVKQLHVFTDASELAMGAVAYVRTIDRNAKIGVALITARSKVAPIKKSTIPRMELSAALMGAELATYLKVTFADQHMNVVFWTDSTIAIHWLRKDPALLKPYVANRVTAIREKSGSGIWRHIQGMDNPADHLTRGMSAEHLKNTSSWWSGPPWLALTEDVWPISQISTLSPDVQATAHTEEKMMWPDMPVMPCTTKTGNFVGIIIDTTMECIGVSIDGQNVPLTSRRSTLSSLLRVTAYIMRFTNRVRKRSGGQQPSAGPITRSSAQQQVSSVVPPIDNSERQAAMRYWISYTQQRFYHQEIKALEAGRSLANNSWLIKLAPFVDNKGCLRVGGRLANANIPDGAKHQIILPPHAPLSKLIIRDAHYVTVHGGPQLMMSHIRRTFWIHRMRQIIKSAVHRCSICVRFSQAPNNQLMGVLPIDRVTPTECFLNTGLDFAGPFNLRRQKGRPPPIEKCSKEPSVPTVKGWIVIFICLASKAVHIDVLLGLTIEEFLAAFERFIMRKGRCSKLYSDNGTTFVGSDKELARVLRSWSSALPEYDLAQFGTQWHFIPPAAPAKGGLWESAVKSMKRHMKRAVGIQMLTRDELYQLAVTIEGCLNSRPLWPISDDPTDPSPLTPAHFLLAKPILPQPVSEDVSEWPANRLTVWGKRQQLQQQIWRRWSDEYLADKQVRTKWYNIRENLSVGNMVIIRKENVPPAMWIIGRVIEVFTAKDGLVRTARIKTPTGVLERPIDKLVFLPQHRASVDQPINGGDNV